MERRGAGGMSGEKRARETKAEGKVYPSLLNNSSTQLVDHSSLILYRHEYLKLFSLKFVYYC